MRFGMGDREHPTHRNFLRPLAAIGVGEVFLITIATEMITNAGCPLNVEDIFHGLILIYGEPAEKRRARGFTWLQ